MRRRPPWRPSRRRRSAGFRLFLRLSAALPRAAPDSNRALNSDPGRDAGQVGSRAGFSENQGEQNRDREPLRERGQSDSEDARHGLGVLPRERHLRVEPLTPDRVREAEGDEEDGGPAAAVAEPPSRPEDERRDPESEEENQRIAPGAMQPGAKQIAELPAVIGIEGRLKKFPDRVQAERQARNGKLREPAQQSGEHDRAARRRQRWKSHVVTLLSTSVGSRSHLPSTALRSAVQELSLIHISEPTRLGMISYAVFCLKKKKK